MLKTKNQPHLRVVTLEGRFELPRRYAQSTSGRVSSTGTAPPLSRSRAIDSPSRKRSLVDSALRKYPTEVPHRLAKRSCSDGSRELRYVRSDSIPDTLPMGKVLSIPSGHLPIGKADYAGGVSETLEKMIYSARKVRFDELVRAHGGNKAFADEVERRLRNYPDLMEGGLASFMNDSYVSNARSGRKSIGEATAMQLELLFDKQPGWMTGDAYENFLIRIRRRRKVG